MKLIINAIFLSLIATSAAHSAEIKVRSGQHSDFARLVLDAPTGAGWVLEQDGSGARVTISEHADGFDISSVFDRIDKELIVSVDSDRNTLSVKFNCFCEAKVFRLGATMIVIDVSVSEVAVLDSAPDTQAPSIRFEGAEYLRFPSDLNQAELQAINGKSTNSSESNKRMFDQRQPKPLPDKFLENQVIELQNAKRKISKNIGIAATTGVLRTSTQRIPFSNTRVRPQIDTEVFEFLPRRSTDSQRTEPIGANLRITSSSDQPVGSTDSFLTSTGLGVRCIDPSVVSVQDWSGGGDFATSISELRRDLFFEFDRPNRQAAVELARRYIFFGFGAEAKQALSVATDLIVENRALMDVAHIMEYGAAQSGNYLEHFSDCDSELALWGILASTNLEPSTPVNSDAAIRALSSLPLHLRRFVAPELSKKLLSYGNEAAAAAALRALERTAEQLPSAAELAKATIELAQGDVESAQKRLEGIVSSNDQQSAQALIKYIDTHLDRDTEMNDDIATLVEAYAIEMRGDPLGEELRRAHVLALAKSNQFDAAFDALDRVRPGRNTSDSDVLYSALVELLARDAEDSTFLRYAFKFISDRSADVSRRTAKLVADRLVNLGFYEEVNSFLLGHQDPPKTVADRLLDARVALGLRKPSEALALLGKLESDEAMALRAQALSLVGDHELAYDLFDSLGNNSERQKAAWLSTEWRELIFPDDSVLSSAVEISNSLLNTSGPVGGMLGRTENILSESTRARSVIEGLLTVGEVADYSSN